jgi:hypothetical protein
MGARHSGARNLLAPLAVLALWGLASCHGGPTEPSESMLADGRWTGAGACLSVSGAVCDLAVGCGHGQFPKPAVRRDGTFDVEGTYRIEAGPVSQNPAPPAHFSGLVVGTTLTLKVVPSDPLPPATYAMRPAAPGTCPVPCV